MKRYPVSVARERLADILDAAEAGERVIIERRGVRYAIEAEKMRGAARRQRKKPLMTVLDDSVMSGQWTWEWRAGGLQFSSPPRQRR